MTDAELMFSTPEDQEFYRQCTEGLPGLGGFAGTGYDAQGNRIPWGSGPHNVQAYREILNQCNPSSIFEIGFNLGYASALFLNILREVNVFSIDISDKKETMEAALTLEALFPERFCFACADSRKLGNPLCFVKRRFDLVFIDGDHTEEFATSDIQLAIDLEVQWIVLDDWLPQFGPGVQAAFNKFPSLELVKVWGNTALVRNGYRS